MVWVCWCGCVCVCVAQFVHLSFVLVCPHPRCDAGRAFAGPPLDDLTCVILCGVRTMSCMFPLLLLLLLLLLLSVDAGSDLVQIC